MNTHTQGDWRAVKSDLNDGRFWIVSKRADSQVADFVCLTSDGNTQQAANASLIAAAPDLLAACKLLLEQYDSSPDFTMGGNLTNKPFLMAREAIKKAAMKL